jgi:hypothetical protein
VRYCGGPRLWLQITSNSGQRGGGGGGEAVLALLAGSLGGAAGEPEKRSMAPGGEGEKRKR